MFGRWKPYVPVSQRRQRAAAEQARLAAAGQGTTPVIIKGRTIAGTPWGKAWCEHLERYSDYANRLPRGRTYVRNGSVIDLQVTPGQVVARVSGSSIYRTAITVQPVPGVYLDRIGPIPALVDEDGVVIKPGDSRYHMNVRIAAGVAYDADELPTFTPLPVTPYRVWFDG